MLSILPWSILWGLQCSASSIKDSHRSIIRQEYPPFMMTPSVSNLVHPCLKLSHHIDINQYSNNCSRSYSHDFNHIISRESGHRGSYHRELSPLQDKDSHGLSHTKSTELLPELYTNLIPIILLPEKNLPKTRSTKCPSIPSMMVQNQWNMIYNVWYTIEFVI